MTTTVKTVLGADIRRFTLDPSTLPAGTSLFAHVSSIVNDSYELRGARISLTYFDDENDQCAVSGDDEMREAFRFAHTHQNKLLKLHVALVDGPAPTLARVPSSAPTAGATTEAKATAAPSPAPAPAATTAAAPATATVVAEVKEVAPPPPPPPQPSAEFVADLAIPDGEVHPAGSTVTKAWSVKNNGKAAWPFGCTLVFKEGALTPGGTVVLPQLAPGETGAIRVQCNVPSQAGRHRSEWILTAPDGKPFDGDASMWAEVVVRAPFSAEFVSDVTIPDGTVVPPNATMRKVWRVRNDGIETWKDCVLVYTAGSGSIVPSPFDTTTMTIAPATVVESKDAKESKEDKAPPRIAVPLPTCRPDESIDVSVLMQLPAQSGVARGEWLLCRADGTPFDHDAAVWANVQVTPAPLTKEEMLTQLPALLADGEVRAAVEKLLTAARARADVVVHEGIHCDGCGMAPITGLRFKCTSCEDFDLCEACEAAGNKHPREHVLIKAKRPLSRTPSSVATTAAPATAAATATAPPPPPSLVRGTSGRATASADWRAPAKKPEAKTVTASPSKQRGGAKPAAPKAAGAPRAQFVEDLSLPDGCVVAAGAVVTKRWAIKNVGSAAWPAGVKLMYVGGELQPAPVTAADPTPALSVVPAAPAGRTIECSARVQVPRECGRYTGYYRLATHDDKRFGHRMWLDVLVSDAAAAPTAAPAAAATTAAATPASSSAAPAPTPAASGSASASAAATPAATPAAATPAPTTAAAAPTAGAAPAAPAGQFAAELGRLRAMGFRDDDMLRELLVAAGGKEQQVIDWLVNPVV